MSTQTSSGPIVLITAVESSSLRAHLRDATPFDIRSVSPATLEEESEGVLQSGARDGRNSSPSGIVLELEEPDRTTDVLERLEDTVPTTPTIVAPPTGSETIAAAAVRGNADEYVSPDTDGDRIERIVETIDTNTDTEVGSVDAGVIASGSENETTKTGDSVTADDDYQRIIASELPDEAFVIGADGTYYEANVRPESGELYTASPDELPGKRIEEVFPDDVAAELQACIDRTLRTEEVQSIEYTAETTEGQRRFEARVVPIDERIDGQRAVVWLARDITERARRERELRSRQNQLETLNRISAVVGQVIETLVEAPSRDVIEQEVCEQLVDSKLYCGAWIGERTGEGTLAYRTGAGESETYLECVAERIDEDELLAHRAVRTGEIQMETAVPESDQCPAQLRAAARENDVQSAVAVPITHGKSVYGAVTVLASTEDAVSDSEEAGFNLLGETIGFTIMAVKSRQLLFADTVVELEFRIDGGETFSFDLSEKYDCTISLEWAGTTAKGRTVQYVRVEGLDGETVLEEATDHSSIEECRVIHDSGDSCTIEMRLAESGVRTLANHGATVRDVTVTDGVGTCLIEVSQDANVREIADALTVIYENTELVARREIDRPVRTAADRRNRILDQLTDRQLTTLRLAYYSGFFEWPRESTGEEIAETMGVSPPTMHQHLRKGLKTVLCEFFELGDGTDAD
ncbi:bacterio-opsin activator domain-containing protein [Natronolimnohabitans sp. A-GB9]|uniref:bacterio-opsin activator domain-containing protein n=1 Tax=Natronolimnohabitans sp. A-GB9 TaxID=3069757 RepID=UPI0027B1744F|nr:bacterio-opsin activator domain-containing protein [Natronolimnohabitans sp. A-GB9]MDQ2052077.1 bacterio-opsin activator domain-containing protein [Natronolimnohabitans sp. A-GB9]